jgi:predicted amidophosphoribosyltransferase
VLCGACRQSLRRPGPTICGRCGAPTLWPVERCRECAGRRLAFRRARAAVAYSGAAPHLVAAWKEHGLRRAASLAAELVVEHVDAPAADVITYIPPDPARLLVRGHHPAEQLARQLAGRWCLPAAALLVRAGSVPSARQTGLPRADRLRNVRGAFVSVAAIPASVVLVDDVYTTGATVSAAATALRHAGARQVDVVTFARTTHP